MTLTKLKLATAGLLTVAALGGAVWAGGRTPANEPVALKPQLPAPAKPADPPVAPQPAAERPIAVGYQRARSVNNLKQIALALHNYQDTYGNFPTDIAGKDGKPLLSWRVAILPFLEQDALYKQFKLDEPWDGPANKPLLKLMPAQFQTVAQPKDMTDTYYQGFAGAGTLFEPGKKRKMLNLTDGTSNTLAVAEVGPAVPWTRPADAAYDPTKPFRPTWPFANVLHVVAGDGAVYGLRPDTPEAEFRMWVTIAGGEPNTGRWNKFIQD